MNLTRNYDLVICVNGLDQKMAEVVHQMLQRINAALQFTMGDYTPPRLIGFIPFRTTFDNRQLINNVRSKHAIYDK